MRHRSLGTTGVKVSPRCLGTMMFGAMGNRDHDDSVAALSDLVRQGKVLYIGSSTFPAESIVEAQWAAERRGLERFRCEQPPYSIFARGIETAVLPTAERYGMGVIPWSPLNGGMLTGRYQPGQEIAKVGRASRVDPTNQGVAAKLERVPALENLAADAGISMTHLALAFTLAHPAFSSTIIGPRTMERLEGCLGAGYGKMRSMTDFERSDMVVPVSTRRGPDLAEARAFRPAHDHEHLVAPSRVRCRPRQDLCRVGRSVRGAERRRVQRLAPVPAVDPGERLRLRMRRCPDRPLLGAAQVPEAGPLRLGRRSRLEAARQPSVSAI